VGIALKGFFGRLEAQNKSEEKLNSRMSMKCDEATKGLQLQVESCEVM
jgi:hypothetical protein